MGIRSILSQNLFSRFLLSKRASRFLLKSIRNLFLPHKVQGFGKGIRIEITSICNAKCSFCPYKFNYRKRQTMSFEDFSGIAKKFYKSGIDVNCSFTPLTGEVLAVKDAVRYFKEAKKVGFKKVNFHTNAIAFHKHSIRDILEIVDAIDISFPGFNSEIYKELYQVDRYDEFEISIRELIETHASIGSKTNIALEPRTYLSQQELLDEPFYRDFLSKYISDRITVKEVFDYFDTWNGVIKPVDIPKLKIEPVALRSIYPLKKSYLCSWLFGLNILVDGSVKLCVCRYDGSDAKNDALFIGNINDYDSAYELIDSNTERVRKIFRDFRQGKMPEVCSRCTTYEPCEPQSLELMGIDLG